LIAPKAVAVFGSSRTQQGTREWAEAEDTGKRLADAGLKVVTGGYGGIMEAVSRGASGAGGEVIAVTAPTLFAQRSGANPYVAHEIEAVTLTERIGVLTTISDGAIIMPGSIGTAAEMLIAWNLNHIVRGHGGTRLPAVAIGNVWKEIADLLVTSAGANGEDLHLAVDTEEALSWLLSQPELARHDPSGPSKSRNTRSGT
jgi:uncharacterized protein (TIGR00725 family)